MGGWSSRIKPEGLEDAVNFSILRRGSVLDIQDVLAFRTNLIILLGLFLEGVESVELVISHLKFLVLSLPVPFFAANLVVQWFVLSFSRQKKHFDGCNVS
jgi:hypothetical protein